MIKGVFFDLDGTLFDRHATVQKLLAQQYEAFASELKNHGATPTTQEQSRRSGRDWTRRHSCCRIIIRVIGADNLPERGL